MAVSVAAGAAPTVLGQAPRFRADANLVAVSVTVVDAEGRSVRGLGVTAFTAFEDDRPKPITQFSSDPVPFSLVLAIDTSSSMQGLRFERARQAAVRIVETLSAEDEVCVFGFADSPYRIVDWTRSRDAVFAALGEIQPKGSTALYDTVTSVLDALKGSSRRRQAVVIISDGNDQGATSPQESTTSGWEDSLQRQGVARARIQRSEAMLYAIGIGAPNTTGRSPLDANALRALTDRSGGFTEVVTSPDEIVPSVERIIEELRHQYLVGFRPTVLDGKFHRVKIAVNGCDGCRVRARAGFVAGR